MIGAGRASRTPDSTAMIASCSCAGFEGVTSSANTLFRRACALKNFRYCLNVFRSAAVSGICISSIHMEI